MLKRETHLPVIVDPSHAGGKAWMVPALSCAAVAAGADGLLIEVHPCPAEAWCDADQALSIPEFAALMQRLGALAAGDGALAGGAAASERLEPALSYDRGYACVRIDERLKRRGHGCWSSIISGFARSG